MYTGDGADISTKFEVLTMLSIFITRAVRYTGGNKIPP